MAWNLRAVALPDGTDPVELCLDPTGVLRPGALPGAEQLPGRFALTGLVDAHAHPSVGSGPDGPRPLAARPALATLADWAASGVCLVRDVGSPGGRTLELELTPGLPRLQAAGRFLAPEGGYFPALLATPVPADDLVELALAEVARGARWVKIIADFPALTDGAPSGPEQQNYPIALAAELIAAVHTAGARVAAHTTSAAVVDLVAAGIDSVEHGVAVDEATLHAMAARGAAWTPTLHATLAGAANAPDSVRVWMDEHRRRMGELIPLAARLGVTVLAGTDTVGTLAEEIALLAQCGLAPVDALRAASSAALDFLGSAGDEVRAGTVVTYDADPRADLALLDTPRAVVIGGVRVR